MDGEKTPIGKQPRQVALCTNVSSQMSTAKCQQPKNKYHYQCHQSTAICFSPDVFPFVQKYSSEWEFPEMGDPQSSPWVSILTWFNFG
jgi:hypothetical protein